MVGGQWPASRRKQAEDMPARQWWEAGLGSTHLYKTLVLCSLTFTFLFEALPEQHSRQKMATWTLVYSVVGFPDNSGGQSGTRVVIVSIMLTLFLAISALARRRHVSRDKSSSCLTTSQNSLLMGPWPTFRYEHTSAATLSLPISRASTISTILLPILSFLNTIYYVNSSPRSQTQSSQATCNSLLAPGLQLIQIILTTVLGTTFLADMIPAATQQCLLSTRWQQLWSTKDSSTIRRIQDTFDCCGFNSVKDRAWPFPNKANPQPDCATHLGRTGACVGPWTQALQASGGVEFGVVLGVGVLQVG